MRQLHAMCCASTLVRLLHRKTSIHFSLITSFSTIHMHTHTLRSDRSLLTKRWIWCCHVFNLNLGAHCTIVGFYRSHRTVFYSKFEHYLHITQHIKRIYYSFPVFIRRKCICALMNEKFAAIFPPTENQLSLAIVHLNYNAPHRSCTDSIESTLFSFYRLFAH